MSNTVLEIVRLGMLVNKEKLAMIVTSINTEKLEVGVWHMNNMTPKLNRLWKNVHHINGISDDTLLEILAYLRNLLGDKYIDSPI